MDINSLLNAPASSVVAAIMGWGLGVLGTFVTSLLLRRRGVVDYFVQHNQVGISTADDLFGNVQVTWNGNNVPNLYFSKITVTNRSSRDLEDVRLTIYTNNSRLLTESTHLLGTASIVKYSQEYQEEINVPPGEAPTETQTKKYLRSREYLLPVFNRGQSAEFNLLSAADMQTGPFMLVDLVHKGVTLKYAVPPQMILGAPVQQASVAGTIFGVVLVSLLVLYLENVVLIATLSLALGLSAQIPGAYIVRAISSFVRWIQG